MTELTFENFQDEIIFQASRSSGKGGQHVNKVSSRIELFFDIKNTSLLTDRQKDKILDKLRNRISNLGVLKVAVESERSQFYNKKLAIKKFFDLLHEAFKEQKKRIASKPSRSAVASRLKEKKRASEIKDRRKKDFGKE